MTGAGFAMGPRRHATLLRFLAVGVANTAFGYGVYALAVLVGTPAQLALLIQFVLGVLWNYRLHARLVFAVRGWNRLPAYICSYVAIYLVNAVSLRVLLGQGIDPFLAQLLLLPFIVALSWVLIGRVMGHQSRRAG